MADVEPVETPAAAGPASVPERADTAQRRLAEIWGGGDPAAVRGIEPADAVRDVSEGPSLAVDDDADEAARTLAAIWSTHPASVHEQRSLSARANPVRESQDAQIARLETQLSECSEAFGTDDARTRDARLALAERQLETAQVHEAIPLLEQGIAALQSDDSASPERLAATRGKLAHAYLRTRRTQLAIALYDSLLSDGARGSSADQILGYRIKLAVAHRATGNCTAAVAQLQTLAQELEQTESQNAHLLEAGVELATTHVVAGRPRDAAKMYKRLLPLANEVHGAGHVATLGIRVLLARTLQQAGQGAQAMRSYEQLVSDAERALGANHKLTKQAASELAVLRRARS